MGSGKSHLQALYLCHELVNVALPLIHQKHRRICGDANVGGRVAHQVIQHVGDHRGDMLRELGGDQEVWRQVLTAALHSDWKPVKQMLLTLLSLNPKYKAS